MVGVETLPGQDWLPKHRYVNETTFERVADQMSLMNLGPMGFYNAIMDTKGMFLPTWE